MKYEVSLTTSAIWHFVVSFSNCAAEELPETVPFFSKIPFERIEAFIYIKFIVLYIWNKWSIFNESTTDKILPDSIFSHQHYLI